MSTQPHPLVVNVRGCNGSGKTTLLRSLGRKSGSFLVPVYQPVDLETGKKRGRPIQATVTPDGIALLGDYTLASAQSGCTTAGCDRISRQDDVKEALRNMMKLPDVRAVVFEGIIVSTIYGPWQDFSQQYCWGGMVWAFLDTPLDVCIKRIQERNGGQPIKEELVADKHAGIGRVRDKAFAAGERVVDLRWEHALRDLKAVLAVGEDQ